jgi:hypothetical protein
VERGWQGATLEAEAARDMGSSLHLSRPWDARVPWLAVMSCSWKGQ